MKSVKLLLVLAMLLVGLSSCVCYGPYGEPWVVAPPVVPYITSPAYVYPYGYQRYNYQYRGYRRW